MTHLRPNAASHTYPRERNAHRRGTRPRSCCATFTRVFLQSHTQGGPLRLAQGSIQTAAISTLSSWSFWAPLPAIWSKRGMFEPATRGHPSPTARVSPHQPNPIGEPIRLSPCSPGAAALDIGRPGDDGVTDAKIARVSWSFRRLGNRFVETRHGTAELQATILGCCFLLQMLNESASLVSLN